MKTLIVYYSFSGNNEKLAEYIKLKLDCDILKLEEIRKNRTLFTVMFDILFKRKTKLVDYNKKIKNYDRIIMLSPIWIGNIATPLKTFISNEKENIKDYSFVSICIGTEKQENKIKSFLLKTLKNPPDEIKQISIKKFFSEEDQKFENYMNFKLTDENIHLVDDDIDFLLR